MKQEIKRENIENIYQDLLTCKDFLTNLCIKPEEQPGLKVGFELGSIYMIILRALGEFEELRK